MQHHGVRRQGGPSQMQGLGLLTRRVAVLSGHARRQRAQQRGKPVVVRGRLKPLVVPCSRTSMGCTMSLLHPVVGDRRSYRWGQWIARLPPVGDLTVK